MKPVPAGIPRQWHWHYRALLALRDKLWTERTTRDAVLRTPNDDDRANLNDAASEAEERAELLAELHVEDAELSEVEAALVRLCDGSYGRCADTGRPISTARLRAVPWTRYSREAADRRERAACT